MLKEWLRVTLQFYCVSGLVEVNKDTEDQVPLGLTLRILLFSLSPEIKATSSFLRKV